MISSMTGFGEASKIVNEITVSVDIRSLNSRFLDPRFRLPKQIESLEEKIKTSYELKLTLEDGTLSDQFKRIENYNF